MLGMTITQAGQLMLLKMINANLFRDCVLTVEKLEPTQDASAVIIKYILTNVSVNIGHQRILVSTLQRSAQDITLEVHQEFTTGPVVTTAMIQLLIHAMETSGREVAVKITVESVGRILEEEETSTTSTAGAVMSNVNARSTAVDQ